MFMHGLANNIRGRLGRRQGEALAETLSATAVFHERETGAADA
jgi:hypothetical protein